MPSGLHCSPSLSALPNDLGCSYTAHELSCSLDNACLRRLFPAPKGKASLARWPKNLSVSPTCPKELRSGASWALVDFRLLRKVGEGCNSAVYQALHSPSGRAVALKVCAKCTLTRITRRQIDREIEIHSRLNHQHVAKLYGAFEDEQNVVLIEEYFPRGDLLRHINRSGALREAQVTQNVLRPTLLALDHLHQHGIVHRDLKPENLLLAGCSVKLADFGTAIDMRHERPVSRLGTLQYMPPEVLRCPDRACPDLHKERGDLAYGVHADVWAVGVLLHELLMGRTPFQHATTLLTAKGIMEDEVEIPNEAMSQPARDFILQCLHKDADRRPSIPQLLRHPWLKVDQGGAEGTGTAPMAPAIKPNTLILARQRRQRASKGPAKDGGRPERLTPGMRTN